MKYLLGLVAHGITSELSDVELPSAMKASILGSDASEFSDPSISRPKSLSLDAIVNTILQAYAESTRFGRELDYYSSYKHDIDL
jgi:hypothetical protein